MSVITRETKAKPDAGEAVMPDGGVTPRGTARGEATQNTSGYSSQVSSASIKSDQATRLRDLIATFHQDVVSSVDMARMQAHASASQAASTVVATPRRSASPTTPAPSAPPRLRRVPIVAITSGKGGVGKTSIAVNLCAVLAQRHVRTTLIDADMGLANADVLCGLSPIHRLDSVVPVLTPGAAARPLPRPMRSIALDAPGGFKLVPGSVGVSRMANLAGAERMALLDAMHELEAESDLILVDTGAGLSDAVMSFVRHADLAVVVVTPEPTSIADAYATIKLLKNSERAQHASRSTKVGLVVNMAHSDVEANATFDRIRGTCQRFLRFEPIFLGSLRADSVVPASIRARVPMAVAHPASGVVRQLRGIADRCATEAGVKLTTTRSQPRGASWWQRLWADSTS
jgi:flagellar biosynthesis protein FlhG